MRIIVEARLVHDTGTDVEFAVRELLGTDDGRELLLADDRGWSASGPAPLDLSLARVVADIETVVLPDDAEETGERRTWERYRRSLRERHGVELRLDELRRTGTEFRVVIDPAVLDGGGASSS